MKKTISFFLFFLACIALNAQVQTPQPSPKGKIWQMVGLTEITVEYSRPSMRGREVFGNLVPLDKKWRTGANENTTITFSDDVTIGGEKLAKGKYAIYTIPHKDKWEVLFYKNTNNWGLPQEWNSADVALSTEVDTNSMPFKMETFTIVIDELTSTSAVLNFLWEDVVTSLKIEVPTEEKALKSIETTLEGPSGRDYYAAADYYYRSGKDLKKALEWIDIAVEQEDNPPFWMMRKKALIEAKLGKKKAAIKSAKASLEGAKKAGNEGYIKMNEASLKEWGA